MAKTEEREVYLDDPTGELSGLWLLVVTRSGGLESARRLTHEPTLAELRARDRSRQMTPEEFLEHFGHLPTDDEG